MGEKKDVELLNRNGVYETTVEAVVDAKTERILWSGKFYEFSGTTSHGSVSVPRFIETGETEVKEGTVVVETAHEGKGRLSPFPDADFGSIKMIDQHDPTGPSVPATPSTGAAPAIPSGGVSSVATTTAPTQPAPAPAPAPVPPPAPQPPPPAAAGLASVAHPPAPAPGAPVPHVVVTGPAKVG